MLPAEPAAVVQAMPKTLGKAQDSRSLRRRLGGSHEEEVPQPFNEEAEVDFGHDPSLDWIAGGWQCRNKSMPVVKNVLIPAVSDDTSEQKTRSACDLLGTSTEEPMSNGISSDEAWNVALHSSVQSTSPQCEEMRASADLKLDSKPSNAVVMSEALHTSGEYGDGVDGVGTTSAERSRLKSEDDFEGERESIIGSARFVGDARREHGGEGLGSARLVGCDSVLDRFENRGFLAGGVCPLEVAEAKDRGALLNGLGRLHSRGEPDAASSSITAFDSHQESASASASWCSSRPVGSFPSTAQTSSSSSSGHLALNRNVPGSVPNVGLRWSSTVGSCSREESSTSALQRLGDASPLPSLTRHASAPSGTLENSTSTAAAASSSMTEVFPRAWDSLRKLTQHDRRIETEGAATYLGASTVEQDAKRLADEARRLPESHSMPSGYIMSPPSSGSEFWTALSQGTSSSSPLQAQNGRPVRGEMPGQAAVLFGMPAQPAMPHCLPPWSNPTSTSAVLEPPLASPTRGSPPVPGVPWMCNHLPFAGSKGSSWSGSAPSGGAAQSRSCASPPRISASPARHVPTFTASEATSVAAGTRSGAATPGTPAPAPPPAGNQRGLAGPHAYAPVQTRGGLTASASQAPSVRSTLPSSAGAASPGAAISTPVPPRPPTGLHISGPTGQRPPLPPGVGSSVPHPASSTATSRSSQRV
eukprot:gnl/TRDRNA2_/TRDRNA2_165418_c0_seq1.p1 gnl/TRDRNA2_/TRDRNA2_165418_c0~~gnl/TRDRNA2_/TRDRNA2_165418_c0_seq1.p1  ORF type:complete len:701 (+),score=74.37 gnl/TRDRNA2_/TRDRNA2_165418_c0_seq1:67-2169(+)